MHDLKITDVRALEGDSAFLIDDGKTSVLCDSGFAFTGARVADNIRNVLGSRGLDYIFLTHSHYDHALGSVYAKKAYPDAKVVKIEVTDRKGYDVDLSNGFDIEFDKKMNVRDIDR